jgi:small redox-active disulfide protein 2
MKIIVLGTGCARCNMLEKMVRNKVAQLKLDVTIEKEEDIMNIIAYGIRRTPALVIDDKVVLYGRVPTDKELTELLTR